MKALLASPRGFCAGVDRAIDVVEEALEIFGGIFYIGHKGHVETEGTLGEAPGRLHLVCDLADVAWLAEPPEDKLIYLTQTTLSIDETQEIVEALRARFPRLENPPTGDICYATQNRQDAIKVIAPQSDVVLVIGSQTSSNTKSLRQVAEMLGARAYLIGGREDITDAMLLGAGTIGVTSGASAPEDRVQGVLDELRERGVLQVEAVKVREEDMAFTPPREMKLLRMAHAAGK